MRKDKPDANKPQIVAELRERGYVWLDIGGSVDGVCIGYHHEAQQVMAVLSVLVVAILFGVCSWLLYAPDDSAKVIIIGILVFVIIWGVWDDAIQPKH